MTDLKQIKIYVNSQPEIISDIAGIFDMYDIPTNDFKTRRQVLETIAQHQSIILMKKANEVKEVAQTNEIIAEKLKANQEGMTVPVDYEIKPTIKTPVIIDDEDVQVYLELIKGGTPLDEIVQDINSYNNSKNILAKILLYYLSEIKEYNDLIKEASISSREEIKQEIGKVQELIEQIKFLSTFEENKDIEEKSNYKIMFYKTDVGNNSFFSDIKKIEATNYQNIGPLFKSILEGRFPALKKITNNGFLKGMNEVRLSNCRIAFLFEGSYCVILGTFIKKSNIEAVSYDTIAKRITHFNQEKDIIIGGYDEQHTEEESVQILEFLDDQKRMGGK